MADYEASCTTRQLATPLVSSSVHRADTPIASARVHFRGESGHPNLTTPRQLMTQSRHRCPSHRSLAAEFVRSPDCDDGFLPKLGNDSNFDLAPVDVKNRIRWVSLCVENLILFIIRQSPSRVVLAE